MGAIGRWIDERCRTEPDVMRRVLNRKFGPLNRFFDDDGCGCLVGSYLLVRGRDENPQGRERVVGVRVETLCYRYDASLGCHANPCCDAPAKRPDAFVIRLLKQRIRRSLGLAPSKHVTSVQETVAV